MRRYRTWCSGDLVRASNGDRMGLSQANIDELLSGEGAEQPPTAVAEAAPAPPEPAPIVPEPPRTPVVSRILELEVTLSVVLATREMTIDSILATTAGTIIEFEVPFDAELALTVGARTIGLGQTVKIGENFGLRLTQIVGVSERAGALGG